MCVFTCRRFDYLINPKLILMKTLKITLILAAILLLTVSSLQSEKVIIDTELTCKEHSTHVDLLAHRKHKLKMPGKD